MNISENKKLVVTNIKYTPELFFQVGGSLPKDFPSYIKRTADEEIYSTLKVGKFCYVLSARQMGKSSLRIRTMDRLQKEGFVCVSIEITSIGVNISANQWYYGFLYQLSRSLNLSDKFKSFWKETEEFSPVNKFYEFLHEVVIKEIKQNIIIFLDEIDSMLSLNRNIFSTDDFFAIIRSISNLGAERDDFKRITFAIFGVAAPTDLMQDPARTPFNIGTSIQLRGFKYDEARILLQGFEHIETEKKQLLQEIISWTGGQPILTQRLCKSIASNNTKISNIKDTVFKCVEDLYFRAGTLETDNNLSNIQNRILKNDRYNTHMLSLYRQIINKEEIKIDNTDVVQTYLKLAGLCDSKDGYLIVANKIYENIFNHKWIKNAFGKVNRPFANDMNRWVELNKSESAVLRESVLKQAFEWAKTRDDLSRLEREYLEFSREVENKEKEKRRQEQLVEQRRIQRIKRARVIILIVAIAGVIASGLAIWGFKQKNRAEKLLDSAKELLYHFKPENGDGIFESFRNKGLKEFKNGFYQEAVNSFSFAKIAFDKPPNNEIDKKIEDAKQCNRLAQLANQESFRKNYNKAKQLYTRILEINPDDSSSKILKESSKKMDFSKNMVFVEGGTFKMGNPDITGGSSDERPVHEVFLNSFYISKYEVTNSEFSIFLNQHGSDTIKTGEHRGQKMIYEHEWGVRKNGRAWKPQPGYENHPVVHVTWVGAYEFCKYYGLRLPTEAEWEYAAKGGKKSNNYKYSGSDDPEDVAWFYSKVTERGTHIVGEKRPNELGIYDMSGNVWEWCNDWHSENYSGRIYKNPQGPSEGVSKILRGGSWRGDEYDMRTANRFRDSPIGRGSNIGFRFACDVK